MGLKTVLGAVALVAGACAGCQPAGTPQAKTAPVASSAPAPAGGIFFPVMPWELPPRAERFEKDPDGLANLAACGFNVAAFVRKQDVPRVRSLGMKAIVREDPHRMVWRDLSDAQIEARVRAMVAGTEHDATVIGYFLTDEPGVREFPALGKAVVWVKKLAPGKIAYINLYPNYATIGAPDLSQLGTNSYEEYLERYITEVRPQVISYDNYQVEFSDDLKEARRADLYFTNLVQVRSAALKHGLPWWQIVSGNQIRPETPVPSPANLLLQAYTTLAAGAKGVTWYTYYGYGYKYAAVTRDDHRTATWSYLRMVNDQLRVIGPIMAELRNTGVYVGGPGAPAGITKLPGEVVQNVDAAGPVMVGEFAGADGGRWAMVVNLSLERAAKVGMKWRGEAKGVRQVSPVDGSLLPLDAGDNVWLPAGQGVLLNLAK